MSEINLREYMESISNYHPKLLSADISRDIKRVLAATQDVRLTTSWEGEGDLLFHVSIFSISWDRGEKPTMWTVIADDLDGAIAKAIAMHDNEEDEFLPEDQDGYEIGRLL